MRDVRVITAARPVQELMAEIHDAGGNPAGRATFETRNDATSSWPCSPNAAPTWLKALSLTITNQRPYGFGDHPLLAHQPQNLVPCVVFRGVGGDHADLNALTSHRLLATHIPLSLLPPEMTSSCSGRRIVHLCRDPKDAFVSRWNFDKKI